MTGEFEAAGAMADAALIAGAIEGRDPGEAGQGDCLNCGAQLNGGRFCANCGQAAHANRSLWHLVEELAWNVFNLDTKAWRTVPRLVVRPGTLTRTYIDGKRARYLSPLATFLLCFFLMFFVFSLVPKPSTVNLSDGDATQHVSDARDNLKDAQEGLQEAQQQLTEVRQDAGAHPNAVQQAALTRVERALADQQARVQRRQAALSRAEQRQHVAENAPVNVNVSDDGVATTTAPAAPVVTAPPSASTTPPAPPAVSAPDLNTANGPTTLDDVLRKIARENVTTDGRAWLSPSARAQLANPPLFWSHLQEAASRWGFLLVPISLPFIAFLFLFKKDITLYDHTVFALNSLSFASLLFALMLGAAPVAWLHWVPGIAMGVVLPVHTFFHVGGAYKLKWWSAFWRTFFLLFFALISLIIFLVAVLFIGLAG